MRDCLSATDGQISRESGSYQNKQRRCGGITLLKPLYFSVYILHVQKSPVTEAENNEKRSRKKKHNTDIH